MTSYTHALHRAANFGMVRCFGCGAEAMLEACHVGADLVIRCSCTCGATPQLFRRTDGGWQLVEEFQDVDPASQPC